MKKYLTHLLFFILFMPTVWAGSKISVDTVVGTLEHVNAYIIHDETSAILIDAQVDNANAQRLSQRLKAKNVRLTHILITHAHADHYLGLATILADFPKARVVVANQQIKQRIIANTQFMEKKGFLSVAAMASEKFDYEQRINVLKEKVLLLDSGYRLVIEDQYLLSETDFITTVYSQELNALFASDLAYHRVHPWLGSWMGISVDQAAMHNWRMNLKQISTRYPQVTIYPGHGKAGRIDMFDAFDTYLDAFNQTVKTSTSKQQAFDALTKRFPDYVEADFFLRLSLEYHMADKD